MLLLVMNIFIHIQQPSLRSINIVIHVKRCISYPRLYLLTFMRCLTHIQRVIFVYTHDRNVRSTFSVHHPQSAHH